MIKFIITAAVIHFAYVHLVATPPAMLAATPPQIIEATPPQYIPATPPKLLRSHER